MARDESKDVHYSFASLRRRPKCTAVYVYGEADDPNREVDLPFRVSDLVSSVGHLRKIKI